MTWDDRPEKDVWFSVDPQGREEPDDTQGRRRGPSFLAVLLGLVVVAIAAIAWVNRSSQDRATPPPSPTVSSPTPTAPTSEVPSGTTSSLPASTVTTIAGAKAPLGATRPWDLFVATGRTLTRIDMATGRTVRLELPFDTQQSPTAIVDLGGRILVQAVYDGTGIIVTDAGSVTRAAPSYPGQAQIFPALGARRLWASNPTDQVNRLDLLTVDGRRVTGGSVTLPTDLFADTARSDGGLTLLVDGFDGTYRADGGVLRRITTGQYLGRSDAGWLVQECDDDHRCGLYFADRQSGARRSLGGPLANPLGGSISPDGRSAVVFDNSPNGTVLVALDLASGRRRQVPGVVAGYDPGGANVVWSPDSRWVVAPRESGRVVGIDTRDGRVVTVSSDGQNATVAARYR